MLDVSSVRGLARTDVHNGYRRQAGGGVDRVSGPTGEGRGAHPRRPSRRARDRAQGAFTKHLEDGIWELRARGPDGIYRVLYFHWFSHTFGLLHGFTKRTQKTPRAELDIARRRRATWLARPAPRR